MSNSASRRSKPKYDVDDLRILLHNMKISDKGYNPGDEIKKWKIIRELRYKRFLNKLGSFNIQQLIYYSRNQKRYDTWMITWGIFSQAPLQPKVIYGTSKARNTPLNEMHQIVRIINNTMINNGGTNVSTLIINYCW
jgi:hypothetical protein